jgi:hypothetical protein
MSLERSEKFPPRNTCPLQAIHGCESQFVTKRRELAQNVPMLFLVLCPFVFACVFVQRGFDNPLIGVTVFHDAAQAVFDFAQLRKALFVVADRFPPSQSQRGVHADLERFWMGHENETVGGGYSKMKEDVEFRLEQAETVGLGLALPPKIADVVRIVRKKRKQNLKLKTRRNLLNREGERPHAWVTVCTGHIGDTSSPRGGCDALEGVFGYG